MGAGLDSFLCLGVRFSVHFKDLRCTYVYRDFVVEVLFSNRFPGHTDDIRKPQTPRVVPEIKVFLKFLEIA